MFANIFGTTLASLEPAFDPDAPPDQRRRQRGASISLSFFHKKYTPVSLSAYNKHYCAQPGGGGNFHYGGDGAASER